jgi:hypothetical protein
MAQERKQPDWFDFAIAAISPVLIMGLVGSLAFFLLDVLYGGIYAERLYWTLFFFVVGSVLVARIAIVVDPGRAKLYGIVLAGAAFLAALQYAAGTIGPLGWLICLVIILVVLWSSNKLVWNCTFLDEKDPDPGRGLLATVANPGREPGGEGTEGQHASEANHPPAHAGGSPGITVIYFTLAAFPLFAIGQSLIPLGETGRRQWAFLCMTAYVACGLGLLLTTTLLGLRRYLRQRRLTMPTAMTGLWLGVGGILIALVLLVGGFFPRPHAEYPLFSWARVGSPDREASRIGQGDSPGKGEGRASAKGEGDAQEGSGKGQEGGKSQGQSGKPEGGDGGQKGGGAKSGKDGDKGPGKSGQGRDNPSSSDSQSPGLPQWFTNGLKWALIVMVGIPIAILLMLFVLRRLDSLPGWLQKWVDALISWWQSLFGRTPEPAGQPVSEIVEDVRPERPFRSFSNPFADGSAARRSPDELVRYSFAALDAWAGERDLGRGDEETPREFAERLGAAAPDLADASRVLATHYANLAYGRRRVPESARTHVEDLWLMMEEAAMGARSASNADAH